MKFGKTIESQYLKPPFKSEKTNLRPITLENKGPVLFLIKDGRIISEIYVNQVLRPLAISLYEECMKEI